jgi:hypothetical protein
LRPASSVRYHRGDPRMPNPRIKEPIA